MSTFVLQVPWRDANRQGLNGVVEVRSSDFPRGKLIDAQVCDLMAIVNEKICETTSHKREVAQFLLHGIQVRRTFRLEYLVPELLSSSPRFLATTHIQSMRTGGTPMSVFVCNSSGKTTAIQCRPTDTIAFVKTKIQAKQGIAPKSQRLVFGGRQLQDNRTLLSYNVGDASTIFLSGRLRGGGGLTPTRTFADVSDGSIITAIEFSDKAPEWRVCSKGLNIEGRCENYECPAFNKMAIHRKKFKIFNLIRDDDVRCPLCKWKMKPVTCGLYDCSWRIEGVKAQDGMCISSQWKNAEGYVYHRFNADENENCVDWANLLIMVKQSGEPMVGMALLLSKYVAISESDTCSICWSPFGSPCKKSMTKTHCGHNFHGGCMNKWSMACKSNGIVPSCPICRRTA